MLQDYIKINLDSDLNETDLENLQDMSFELPSVVFKNKQIAETLDKIKTENRRIGQKLGRSSDVKENERQIFDLDHNPISCYQGDTQYAILGLPNKPHHYKYWPDSTVDMLAY